MSVSCWSEESGIVAELRPPDGVQQGDERGLVAERQSQHLLRLEVGDPGIIVAENPPEHLFGMFAELGRECSGRGRNTSKAHGLWHVADRTEVVTDPAEDHPPRHCHVK